MKKEENEKKYGSKKDILLVNCVTGLRFIGSFFVIPTFKSLSGIAAALFSAIFLFTDFIDGQLARKLKSSTFFGALFDGLTDKAFGITCLLLLMSINPILFSIPLLLECGILLTQNKKFEKGLNVQSNMTGKVKTWFLSMSIVGSFLAVDLLNIPDFITYIKYFSLDKIANIEKTLALFSIELPSIIAQILTLKSYKKEANEEEKIEESVNEQIEFELDKIEIQPEIRLQEIAEEKKQLQNELTNLEKLKILGEKMFDPEYYAENKDMPIRKLTNELFNK